MISSQLEHQFDAPRRSIIVRLVLGYQRAAEGRPSPCRFSPTCSSYAIEAFELHGTWHGLALTVRRFLRCRPFGPSGWDPVPQPLLGRHTVRRRHALTRKHVTS